MILNPNLKAAILARLSHWGQPVQHQPHHFTSRPVRLAILQQDLMGWFQFLLGRHPTAFETIQQQHLTQEDLPGSGKRWAIALVRKSFEVSWDMWQHRNGILHGEPDTIFCIARDDDINPLIQEQFALGPNTLLGRDRHLLRLLEADLLARTRHLKIRWLSTVTLSREAYANPEEPAMSDAMRQMRKDMRRWLGQNPNIRPPRPAAKVKKPKRSKSADTAAMNQLQKAMGDWTGKETDTSKLPNSPIKKKKVPRRSKSTPKATLDPSQMSITSFLS